MKKGLRGFTAVLLALLLIGLVACTSPQPQPASTPAPAEPAAEPAAADVYSRTEALKLSIAKLGNDGEFDNQRPAIHYLMDLTEEYSGGMITYDFYPAGQLGAESDMLDQVINGDLDMAMLSEGTFASVTPEVSLTLMPFLFNDSEEFYQVASIETASEYQQAVVNAVDSYGQFKYIGPMNGLFRAFSNTKHPVTNIGDLKNLNLRIQAGDIYTDSYKALGASTATITFAELYTSLQQGAVDAEDLSFPFYFSYKYYEVEPYTTEMRMFYQTINLIVSNECWNNKFTDQDREIFMKAAQEAQRLGWQDQYTMDEEVFKQISALDGINLVRYSELNAEDIEAFREAIQPVWEKYSAKNPQVWEALQNCIQEYRSK
jgi:TRAP-type C4-dicarboxylate transport system substrate-binding protein